jgi:large subunit ribosomal protein L22
MASNEKKKAAKVAEIKEKRPHATAKHIRMSPYKVRTVLDLIRGKSVQEAAAILQYCDKISSEPVRKVLMSAIANAEHKEMDKNDLIVAECYADQGPSLKRINPVSKGRAHAILKRTSHITVVLDVKAEARR